MRSRETEWRGGKAARQDNRDMQAAEDHEALPGDPAIGRVQLRFAASPGRQKQKDRDRQKRGTGIPGWRQRVVEGNRGQRIEHGRAKAVTGEKSQEKSPSQMGRPSP